MSGIGRIVRGLIVSSTLLAGCSGSIDGDGASSNPDGTPRSPGTGGMPGTGGGGAGALPKNPDGTPVAPPSNLIPTQGTCSGALPTRVTRLADRHLANAIRDLLDLAAAPRIQTGVGALEEFLPNKPAAVNGSVALSLRDAVELAASEATAAGKPAIRCTTAEGDCARTFIDQFAGRAFRRMTTADERDKLFSIYTAGKASDGTHAGGIRLVIEAVLQSPSFLYLSELGTAAGKRRKLTPFELASKVSFFLRDSVPDEALWMAAQSGKLATPEGLSAEIDRLMKLPAVKANIGKMIQRLVQLDRIFDISKATTVKEFTPALKMSMYQETERFIDDVLWTGGGKLSDLLTSRKGFVDKTLAPIYGLKPPTASGMTEVLLPADQRAGILTQASVLTTEALPDESSVVHRGVFIVRELLCFNPPPPQADDLTQGEALKKAEPTERGRSERRMAIARCSGCHSFFDPLGIAFENYDTLGRYRTTIATAGGAVPVNASWTFDLHDVQGPVANGVELSKKLAASKAVRDCMVRQFTSYAVGQRLDDDQACAAADISKKFEASDGSMVELVRAVANWNGLSDRVEGVSP